MQCSCTTQNQHIIMEWVLDNNSIIMYQRTCFARSIKKNKKTKSSRLSNFTFECHRTKHSINFFIPVLNEISFPDIKPIINICFYRCALWIEIIHSENFMYKNRIKLDSCSI